MDEAILFLVRVWQARAGFRASARRLDEEQAHLFQAPEALARHLASASPCRPADAPVGAIEIQGEKT